MLPHQLYSVYPESYSYETAGWQAHGKEDRVQAESEMYDLVGKVNSPFTS